MRSVDVHLPSERGYSIKIGSALFADAHLFNTSDAMLPYQKGGQVAIISDSRVAPLYLDQIAALFPNSEVIRWVFSEGEENKTLESVAGLYSHLIESHCDRLTLLIALGGGVVGDMVGFAAATYLRGVPYVQIPTTLLAQVDSSVGGKTAVNHPLGKNMIGAFYQPRAVFIDTSTLETLDPRQFRSGLAEVIKYGVIFDEPFLAWLESHVDALNQLNPAALKHAIAICCELKAKIVAADERESGVRASLNYGHTFGHAIEAAAGYGHWLHGEAVAVGMLMAARLAIRMGLFSSDEYERLYRLIEAAGLPLKPPSLMTPDVFMSYMKRDKKVLAGSLRLVLPKGLGDFLITADYPESDLYAVLEEFCQ